MITGLPRSGKTTLIKRILRVNSVSKTAGGFITEEVRENKDRIGFDITTLPEGRTGLLARIGFASRYRVGRYGVSVEMLEELGCPAILQAKANRGLVIIDEIGKMELFSEKFRSTLIDVLDSPMRVIATIMKRPNAFSDRIKQRSDVRLFYLERKNFDEVFTETINWLDKHQQVCL